MMERLEFIRSMATLTSALILGGKVRGQAAEAPARDQWGEILPMRTLGATGERVTMLGLGGFHIGLCATDAEAQALIETAMAGGIRFFDTAWGYAGGLSEQRYGQFLIPRYRDQIYLMSKTPANTAEEATQQLDETLRRLKTDHLDLWQVHSLFDPADVDRRVDQGVLDVVRKAKADGKVRHIGFTGHRQPDAQLRMLERSSDFETCQMPINVLDPHAYSFTRQVMPQLIERKMGILAMKTLADGRFFANLQRGNSRWATAEPIVPDVVGIKEALDYVWSLPVSVLITGPDNPAQLNEKIELARQFKPMTAEAIDALLARTESYGKRSVGNWEFYKDPKPYA